MTLRPLQAALEVEDSGMASGSLLNLLMRKRYRYEEHFDQNRIHWHWTYR
jgi:hypothetical protein